MDAKELHTIIEGIARDLPNALLKNKGFEELVSALLRIASYLKSEQDERIRFELKMRKYEEISLQTEKLIWGDKDDIENKPGLAHEMAAARKQSRRNGQLLYGVLATVIAAIVLMLLQMAGLKIK